MDATRRVILTLLLAVTAPCVVSAQQPVATRQNRFVIPFHVVRPGGGSAQPVEVRLYVSADGGQRWKPAGRTAPGRGYFDFTAPRDGEYLFSIRNVDRQGNEYPAGTHRAGLVAVVDTRRPELKLSAVAAGSGQVQVRWQTSDENLDPETLTIQYRADKDGSWRRLAIGSPQPGGPLGVRNGEATFLPAVENGLVNLRAEVLDRAGNRVEVQDRVRLAAGSTAQPSTGGYPPRAGDSVTYRQPDTRTHDTRFAPAEPAPVAPAWQASPEGRPAASTVPWSPDESLARASDHGRNAYGPANVFPAESNASTPDRGVPVYPTTAGRAAAPIASAPDAAAVAPVVTAPDAAAFGAAIRSGPATKSFNTRTFQLDYDDRVVAGAAGFAVELWGTADGGRTWTTYAVDRDGRSPASVVVLSEGSYGFRLVVRGARGRLGQVPGAGDAADVLVAVDLTPPRARLLAAEQGTGAAAGELIILWEASDTALADRPVTLSYGFRPSGRRTVIAEGLKNTGRYAWRLPVEVPERIYLHLDVRDAAGNVSDTHPSQAVQIRDPAARSSEPANSSDRSAMRPRRYQFFH